MVVSWENECPESGEFFFNEILWQKFSLKVDNSTQNWPAQHVNSHFLIDQPRTAALKARKGRNPVEKIPKYKCQIGGAQVANWRKGEKQLYSRTQCTFASLVNEKVRVHVSSRPILCGVVHFQWKFLSQSAMEEKFPALRPFVLPTHNQVSWGTWLTVTQWPVTHFLPKADPVSFTQFYFPFSCFFFKGRDTWIIKQLLHCIYFQILGDVPDKNNLMRL